jgi:transposase
MIKSLVIRIVEKIPSNKALIKRLKDDWIFKLNCGFLSDNLRKYTVPARGSQAWKTFFKKRTAVDELMRISKSSIS